MLYQWTPVSMIRVCGPLQSLDSSCDHAGLDGCCISHPADHSEYPYRHWKSICVQTYHHFPAGLFTFLSGHDSSRPRPGAGQSLKVSGVSADPAFTSKSLSKKPSEMKLHDEHPVGRAISAKDPRLFPTGQVFGQVGPDLAFRAGQSGAYYHWGFRHHICPVCLC